MTGRSDRELLGQFQQGDESAFNELVLRYQERIYWVASRFLQDHDDADDVVQEVFLKVYEGLRTFRGESGLYTWMYRITVNASLNFLRRRRVKEFFRLDDMAEERSAESERPDNALERKEERTLIEEAIERLPDKQKAVFLMRYYDELPYDEIGRILGTSVGGLKANYFHAVRKIENYVKRAHQSP
ncbi:MAG: RNA polymerase sigma factor [Ignavibacteriales bacterium]|nr:RNA polymerase sigma factor [Ignavibacteriales bacterium]